MSKLTRRDFLKGSAAAGAALAGNALPGAARLLAQDNPTVDYWHGFIAEFVHAGFEVVLENFHQANPDITINPLTVPNSEFMTKFTTSVVGNAAPDTTMAAPTRIPDMVAIGGLQDISGRVGESGLMDNIPADRWDGATIDGAIYGVPSFMFVDWMYYRADWFEEAGLDPPTTWEAFTEAAIAMTDADSGRYGFGMRGGNGGQGFVVKVIESFGSPIIDDMGQPAMDFDKAVEALRWYTDLHTVHGAVPPSVANDSFRQLMEAFQTGQTAMLWHHTGSLAEMRTVLGDEGAFSTALRPHGPENQIASATPSYNGISMPGDGEEDASWEWISYWADINTQVDFLELTGYFPSSALVAEDERVQSNPLYAAAVATVDEVGPPTRFPGGPGWERNVVLPNFQRVLLGEITAEDAIELMMEGLEEAVSG